MQQKETRRYATKGWQTRYNGTGKGEIMTSIIVAAITGLFSFFGIIVSSKAQHTKTVEEVNTSIVLIQKDIKNLETLQNITQPNII